MSKNTPPESTTHNAGYSGTPLSRKLGIKPGYEVLVYEQPDHYLSLLEPIPEGVQFRKRLTSQADIVHVFVTRKSRLASRLQQLRKLLENDIPIWVSWPKKSSGVSSNITEDTVRELALPLGYVDIKVCAVDQTWSALKLVVRKNLR